MITIASRIVEAKLNGVYLYVRLNGIYRVRVDLTIDGEKISRTTTYRPEKKFSEEENHRAAEITGKLFAEEIVKEYEDRKKGKRIAFEEFFENEYKKRGGARIADGTFDFNVRTIEKDFWEDLTSVEVREIDKNMLQKLADQLGGKVNENICKDLEDLEDLEDPVQVLIKPQTVKRYMTALRAVLKLAYEDGILEEDPSTWALKYPKFFYTPIECLEPDDYACIINNLKFKVENSSLELIDIIVAIGLLAGLRRGEIVALRWKDFRGLGEKPNNEILLSVTKSAYKPKGSEQIIKDVKTTDSVRRFVIEEILAEVLVSWKNKLIKLGVPTGDNNHIVCNERGNMVSVYSPTKWFGEYLEEHNFRHVKLHSLRHTFASILIYAGLDIDTVKSLLGHDDIKTTQIYFHEFSMKKGAYISKINKFNTKLLKIKEENKNENKND